MGDESQHLPDEGDGLVPHGMSISNISLDYRGERLLDTILQLLKEGWSGQNMKLVTRYLYLFNSSCSDDKRTPDCILHLLDAGVHVVQG